MFFADRFLFYKSGRSGCFFLQLNFFHIPGHFSFPDYPLRRNIPISYSGIYRHKIFSRRFQFFRFYKSTARADLPVLSKARSEALLAKTARLKKLNQEYQKSFLGFFPSPPAACFEFPKAAPRQASAPRIWRFEELLEHIGRLCCLWRNNQLFFPGDHRLLKDRIK